MAKKIKLTEASKVVFKSSSDDDASSDSSYSPDSEDYSETSDGESKVTFQKCNNPVVVMMMRQGHNH